MKTLAEFKRALQPGVKVQGTRHAWALNDKETDLGVREVSTRQAAAVAFKCPDGKESWMHFPKAGLLRFNSDGSVTILAEDGTPRLTYKILHDDGK